MKVFLRGELYMFNTPGILKKIKKASAVCLIFAVVLSCGGGFPAGIASAAEKAALQEMKESLITMSFPGAQLGYILQSLGKVYGANFSISSGAAAQVVTIEFKDTKFQDVLEMIRAAANVTIKEVYPNSYVVNLVNEGMDDKDKTEQERSMKALEERLSNGIMKTFVLNYVGASDVSDTLNNILGENTKSVCSVAVLGETSSSSGSGTTSSSESDSPMSDREYATIVVYAANNKIMDYISNVIKEMDKPKPMVEVEAVFVEVASNKNTNLGFDWSIMPDPLKFVESSIGAVLVDNPEELTPIYRKTTIGQMRRTSGVSAEMQLNMNEGNGRGRVLSNPRIRVMSGYTAGFISETQVPILNKDSDGEIKTEYKNVGVNLDILPVVLDNDQIYLTVAPSVSSITDTVTLGDTKAPQIASRSAETTVLMRDGETMVIGGLLSDRDIKSMSKVPILWKIPLLGELFKNESVSKEHSSISVYIRVRLIRDYMNEKTATNIPDAQIEKLLTAHRPKVAVANAAGRTSGDLRETVSIEGILPPSMVNEKTKRVTTEIKPAVEPIREQNTQTEKLPGTKSDETASEQAAAGVSQQENSGTDAEYEAFVAQMKADHEAAKNKKAEQAAAPKEEKKDEKVPESQGQNTDVSGYLY